MLTKREKILLQILGILFLLALAVSLLLTPSVTACMQSGEEAISAGQELARAEEIREYPGLQKRLDQEKQKADENYQYFYEVLNSYTIDGIVNHLLQTNGLDIKRLDITPYEDAFYDFVLYEDDLETGTVTEEENTENKVLVKSIITVNVEGTYAQILHFIDDLNATSSCLRVSSATVSDGAGILGEITGKSAELKIYVYGINLEPISE